MAAAIVTRTLVRVKFLLAVAVAASLLVPAAAHAQDRRPCVSRVEYQSIQGKLNPVGAPRMTRREVEDRWDVRGLGVLDAEFSDDRVQMWVYRACGYPEDVSQIWALFRTDNQRSLGTFRIAPHGATPVAQP